MTKEEKKAKGKEEEEVPEGFIDAVNEFYETSDIIFKCFDDIYNDYLQGKNIREELKGFRRTKPIIYWLLAYIKMESICSICINPLQNVTSHQAFVGFLYP